MYAAPNSGDISLNETLEFPPPPPPPLSLSLSIHFAVYYMAERRAWRGWCASSGAPPSATNRGRRVTEWFEPGQRAVPPDPNDREQRLQRGEKGYSGREHS